MADWNGNAPGEKVVGRPIQATQEHWDQIFKKGHPPIHEEPPIDFSELGEEQCPNCGSPMIDGHFACYGNCLI